MKLRIPKIKSHKSRVPRPSARHSAPGRATRKPSEPSRYRGSHRGVPVFSDGATGTRIPRAVRPSEPVARQRVPGRRLTPLSDRPSDAQPSRGRLLSSRVRKAPAPRARFAGADTVPARIGYQRAQRAELQAQAAAGGGKLDRSAGTKIRTLGQGRPARSRFEGEPSSAEKNRIAKQLHPTAATVRGTSPAKTLGRAKRPAARMPGDPTPPRTPSQKRAASAPMPGRPPRDFARTFFGQHNTSPIGRPPT
jgi:hypothetical protein